MSIFDRAARVIRAEMPGLQDDLAQGAKKVGNMLDDWLTQAEERTFGNPGIDNGARYADTFDTPTSTAPRATTNPRVEPFSQSGHFTRVLDTGGIDAPQSLKLIGAAHRRGFTPELKTWLQKSEMNKSKVVQPLTQLLGDRSQAATIQDEVFYRAHKLDLQPDLLKWLQSRPDLNDTVGMGYRNFYAQLKKVPERLRLDDPVTFSDAEIATGREFAKTISNALQRTS